MGKIKLFGVKLPLAMNTILLLIAGALGLFIITGTIIGLVRSKESPPLITFGKTNSNQIEERSFLNDDIRIFSGIGRLRITLANSSVLILSIAFPFQANDMAFEEELAGKIGDLKNIAIEYFSSLPEAEIIQINEDEAKTEILNRYNSILRLGRISALYFNDMMIIDAY